MNAREMYNAIRRNTHTDQQQVLFELLSLLQVASTAILELAGRERLTTGREPLTDHSRLILSEFIELKPSERMR